MKWNRLLIALAALAVMGGLVWWSNKQEQAKIDKPADTSTRILSLKEDSVRSIEIVSQGGVATVLKKDDSGKWSITAPAPLAADPSAISVLLSAASNLLADRIVDENVTDLASYGLSPAKVTVTLGLADGSQKKLLIGEENPTGNSVYAKVEGDNRLYTMLTSNRNNLDKSSQDLREKHLLSFETDKVSRIELTAKKQSAEFGRVGSAEWQILKPKPSRADSFQVEELLRKIHDAQMDADQGGDAAKKAASAFASATPVGLAKITGPGGEMTLEVRKAKDEFYAKSSGLAGVYKVSKDLGDAVDKAVDDFRNKKIFDFGFNDPSRIEVTDAGKSAKFEKQADKWQSNGKSMDGVGVQSLIDKLRDLSAVKFIDLGFIAPVMEFTVVSNEGKRTEKVQICTYAKNYLARRENDGTLYEIEGSVIDDLRNAIAGVREAAPDVKK